MLPHFDDGRFLIPFRSLLLPHIFTDTLVVGAGVAGSRAAIAAAEHGEVIVLAKSRLDISSTAMAQGGLASVVDAADTTESHATDTFDAGGGLCDPAAVRTLVNETPERVDELLAWGMQFDRDADGELSLGREGGHRAHRILHSDGAATGRELTRCLLERIGQSQSIRVFDRCFMVDLLSAENNDRILGALTYHPRYGLQIIWAKATILAAGGAGQVFRETTNPSVATGDAIAAAYRAGASVADLEFIQFHPTTLYIAGSGRWLISEAVRGEGTYLVDRAGNRFMADYHEMGELAPRDIVSRSIIEHLSRTDETHVFLDARDLPAGHFHRRFPHLTATLATYDLDPERDLIPVHPSAHYTVAGVSTDLHGRTSLPGLYACGEAACSGLHGANRLASNSLTEGLVFGQRAGSAAEEMASMSIGPRQIISDLRFDEHGELDLTDVQSSLRSTMWRNVGIQRTGQKLNDVVDMCTFWARYTLQTIFDDPLGWETQNMLTTAVLIARAAAWREETRGVHCRTDFPDLDDDRFHCRARWSIGVATPEIVAVDSTEVSS